jgi:large subunit ribosomal protein L22
MTEVLTKAVAKFIRVSPRKARLVADLVRGKSVEEALAILQYSPQAAARLIEKVLRSAVANAEHNHQIRSFEGFRVGVTIDGGPMLKRIQPRAMGRAYRILHRTSHVTVTLGGGGDAIRPRGVGPAGSSGAKGARRAVSAAATRSQ